MKMKKSNKLMLVVIIIPALIVAVIFLNLKMKHNDIQKAKSLQQKSGAEMIRTIDLEGLSEILVQGDWDIHVIQGKSSKAEIKAPENMRDKITIEKSGATLLILENRQPLGPFGDKHMEATIIMPVINKIDLNGSTSLDFSEVNSENLVISMQGVSKVIGSNSKIQNLSLIGIGASTVNLSGSSVTNAAIEYYGNYTINLSMNGGTLSGRLEGVGAVTYDGDVTVNEIKADTQENRVVHKQEAN